MASECDKESVSAADASTSLNVTSAMPDVIKDGYRNYLTDVQKGKCNATCKRYDKVIHDNMGTTSAFTRHLMAKLRLSMRDE